MFWRTFSLLAVSSALACSGCASGDDGVDPRDDDGGRRIDAGMSSGCTPPCPSGQSCRFAVCVSDTEDADNDGVPATTDCDDNDMSVGSTAQRACTGTCGDGVERCTDGVWEACTAPSSCDCTPGSPARLLDCGTCGTQRQACVDGAWLDDGPCMEAGTCTPGMSEDGPACGCGGLQRRTCRTDCSWGGFECVGGGGDCTEGMVDTESRSCSSGSGSETRSRTCGSSCSWGAFTDWVGCPTGPMCGNGTCESGEMCSSCADCQFGHMGTAPDVSGGDSCSGVPTEQWRCVTSDRLGTTVSQVCRGGVWVNFNTSPMNCNTCVCDFTAAACCQAGSPSTSCS
ncbi:MAG: hypothetical protein AB8I08_00985 [Sandaracinaceae bacterium]